MLHVRICGASACVAGGARPDDVRISIRTASARVEMYFLHFHNLGLPSVVLHNSLAKDIISTGLRVFSQAPRAKPESGGPKRETIHESLRSLPRALAWCVQRSRTLYIPISPAASYVPATPLYIINIRPAPAPHLPRP